MKICAKCFKEKGDNEFYYLMNGRKNDWCIDCVEKRKNSRKAKITEKDLDDVIKCMARKTKAEKKWEKDKELNAKRCAERKEEYNKFLEEISVLPKYFRRIMEKEMNPPCIVCGKFDTWPYKIGDSGHRLWLCVKHKGKGIK